MHLTVTSATKSRVFATFYAFRNSIATFSRAIARFFVAMHVLLLHFLHLTPIFCSKTSFYYRLFDCYNFVKGKICSNICSFDTLLAS